MTNDILIITGGCSGLGLEIINQALEKNIFVCNLARNKNKMKELNQKFKSNYKGFIGDITDNDFLDKSLTEISKLGNIKYLVNCAEKATFKAPTQYNNEDIELSLMGLKGMIACSTKVLNLKKEADLKIVNIMSSAALKGNKDEALYCAAKWGERGYTESLKAFYKGTDVKIIGVYPGGMNTPFWDENRNYISEEKTKNFMNPKDVATVILDNIINYKNLNVSDIFIERN